MPHPLPARRVPALQALTAGATLLALLFFFCVVFLSGTVSTTDAQTDEAALFTEGYQAYLKGDTDKAIAVLTSVLSSTGWVIPIRKPAAPRKPSPPSAN